MTDDTNETDIRIRFCPACNLVHLDMMIPGGLDEFSVDMTWEQWIGAVNVTMKQRMRFLEAIEQAETAVKN